VLPEELADALDAAVEGGRLVVTSPTPGAAGSIEVEPLEETVVRRFVSRAFVRDEAAEVLLGVLQAEAAGDPPRAAKLTGTVDLSRGVDLRDTGWIAVALDDGAPHQIAVAGVRARATTLEEVVSKINAALGKPVARVEGGRLVLVSPTVGSGSRLALAAPTPEDALPAVGLERGTYRGRDGVRVSYLGTVDLGAGVDLADGAAVRLAVDGGPERQVAVAGADPPHTTVDEIVTAINTAFSARVAIIEGPRIRLQSSSTGAASALDLLPPAGAPDATAAVFGFEPPRRYRGADAEPARVVGTTDLSGGLALERRFLRVAVDAHGPVSVDLGARAAGPARASLDEIVSALDEALGAGVASHDGAGHLVLASPTAGAGGRLVLEPHASRDARAALLGNAPADDTGSDGEPATITGKVDLLAPVDLSRRSTLAIALDDRRPVEIDVAGATPQATFLDEVVAAINGTLPGIAEPTDDDRLRLRWTGTRIAVLPTRVLEVVEYPPARRAEPPVRLRHGETWQIDDDGAAEAEIEVELLALVGIAAPGIVNAELGLELRVLTAVDAGGRLRLRVADGAVEALVTSPGGVQTLVPADALLVEALEADADPADVLRLPRGRSDWRYLECVGTRFDRAHFDRDHWSGGPCAEVGVFDASRWRDDDRPVNPVFGDRDAAAQPSVEVTVRWTRHAPGAFAVNLPVDLPPRFGARFNDGRFGSGEDQVETYAGAVTEPAADPRYLVTLLAGSSLVQAAHVDVLPLGFAPVTLPFRRPQRLTLGAPGVQAAMYLQEADVPGFVEVKAKGAGPQGNQILITAPRAGPASFDVTVRFEAGRFESARAAVAGRPLSASADDLVRPGPIGVLEAKAAGIRAAVWRERTPPVQADDHDE
jgi:hypothetical protein